MRSNTICLESFVIQALRKFVRDSSDISGRKVNKCLMFANAITPRGKIAIKTFISMFRSVENVTFSHWKDKTIAS